MPRAGWIAWIVMLLGACDPVTPPVDAGSDADLPDAVSAPPTDQVDLLLMVANNGPMTEEQASTVTEIPRVVTVLASGHDPLGMIPDFAPAGSLHVGIVDSNMGVGDVTGLARCTPGFGDDGLMQIRARHPGTGCMTDYSVTYPGQVFDFIAGHTVTPAQFGTDIGCVITLGTDGGGCVSQLDASLKAISLTPRADGSSQVSWTRPDYRPPTFYLGTFGHGDDPATNGAFLRPESVLAVVLVTDMDDCSGNPRIHSPDDPAFNTVDLNLRCHTFQDELFPIDRYVDGFAGLRAFPERLVFGAITGVPPALSGASPTDILRDPAMQEQINPTMLNQIIPVCISPGGRGVAYPAVRITRVAQGLVAAGAHVTMQSICTTDFGPAFAAILHEIGGALGPPS
jgi:hypothetical protein